MGVKAYAELSQSQINLFQLGISYQFAGVSVEYDSTVVEHGDRITNLKCQIYILLDEQHCNAHCPDLSDCREDLVHDSWRQTHGWFVQHEQFRATHQCSTEREHLLFAA